MPEELKDSTGRVLAPRIIKACALPELGVAKCGGLINRKADGSGIRIGLGTNLGQMTFYFHNQCACLSIMIFIKSLNTKIIRGFLVHIIVEPIRE
jgi:hypothetical protein